MNGIINFINIKDLGRLGNKLSDYTEVFRKALSNENARVFIPEGEYQITAPLQLRSGTFLKAAPGAVIRLADGAGINGDICLLTNTDHKNGNSGIVVEGGTWDANCAHNPRGNDFDLNAYPGIAIKFIKVDELKLCDMTVSNPDSYFIILGEVENFTVEKNCFKTDFIRPNQDGIHLGGGCKNGIIQNIRALTPSTPNDDMVALNADDDYSRHFNSSIIPGPIENIIIEDLSVIDTYTFVRLLSKGSLIKNIQISNLSGRVQRYAINADNWRFPPGKGRQENIIIKNLNISKINSPENNGRNVPLIIINQHIKNLIIKNFTRLDSDASNAPTLVLDNGGRNMVSMNEIEDVQLAELKETIDASFFTSYDDSSGNNLSPVIIATPIELSEGSIRHFQVSAVKIYTE